jgi:hypothetical protein
MAQIADLMNVPGSLSTALNQNLQKFADLKLNQLMERQQYKQQQERAQEERSRLGNALGGLKGLPQDQAQILSNVPTVEWPKLMPELRQQGLYAGLQPGQQGQQQIQQQPVDTNALMQKYPTQMASMAQAGQPLTQQTAKMKDVNKPIREQEFNKQMQNKQQQEQVQEDQMLRLLNPKDQLAYKQKKEYERRQNEKGTEPYRGRIFKEGEGADWNIASLRALKKLQEEGEVIDSIPYSTLKAMGLDNPAIQNEDTQVFGEIINNFLRNAKTMFGARITNQELGMFMRTLPSLKNTPEGRVRIIDNLLAYNKSSSIRSNAMKEIIAENGGWTPGNIQFLVEQRVGPKLDKLHEKFVNGILGKDWEKKANKNDNANAATMENVGNQSTQNQGEESPVGSSIRNVSGNAARAFETGAGGMGNIEQFAESAIPWAGGKLESLANMIPGGQTITGAIKGAYNTGKEGLKTAQQGINKFVESNLPYAKQVNDTIDKLPHLKTSGTVFPTSEDIRREVTKPLTGEYLEPKTAIERKIQNFTEGVTALTQPIPGANKVMSIKKAAALTGFGNATGWLTAKLTGSEKAGDYVNVGTVMLGSLFGPPVLRKKMDTAFKDADSAVAHNEVVDASSYDRSLKSMKREVKRYGKET